MKVNQILRLFSNKPLVEVIPEGQMIIDRINKYTDNQYSVKTTTGEEAENIINTELTEYVANQLLSEELNDGLNLTDFREDLQAMVDSGKTSIARYIVGGLMTAVAVTTITAYMWMIVSVGLETNTFPDWTTIVLPFAIPGLVIWHIFGILAKERNAALTMALGKSPIRDTIFDVVKSGIQSRLSGVNGSSKMRPMPTSSDRPL